MSLLIHINAKYPKFLYFDSLTHGSKKGEWNDFNIDGLGFEDWCNTVLLEEPNSKTQFIPHCRLNGEPFQCIYQANANRRRVVFIEDVPLSADSNSSELCLALNDAQEVVFYYNHQYPSAIEGMDLSWFGMGLNEFLDLHNDHELIQSQIHDDHISGSIRIKNPVRFQFNDVTLTTVPVHHQGERFQWVAIQLITQSEELGERLFLMEKKYNRIIENFQLGLLEVDHEGVIMKANPSFSKMSGYSLIELLGRDAGGLLLNDENREMMKSINHKRKEGYSDAYELCIRTKKGERRWWLVSGAPNFDREGNEIGSIGIHWDITKQKVLEEQLLSDKNRAEAIAEFKTQFLANMSHEIRTPLNAIVGMTRELKLIASTPQQKEFINVAQIASTTLLSIINDVLDYSKLEAGKLSLENRPFSLGEVIENAAILVADKIKDKKLEFEFIQPHQQLPFLMGDDIRIQQCILNLLSNATKFTQIGKIEVALTVVKEDNQSILTTIQVSDTGVGMDPSYLEHVFEKFSQADETISRTYGGSGLGLSITKSLIEMMGGTIFIDSKKHHGTSVLLTIPFKKSIEAIPISHQQNNTQHNNISGMRVLVVEDNALNRAVAHAFLQRHGVLVTEAHDGIQALEVISNDHFDLVLMDIQMPTIDGIEACKIMRSKGIILPIIALTANAQQSERVKCHNAGMDDYLVKPFEEEEIIQTLSKHYRRRDKSTITMKPQSSSEPSFGLDRIKDLVGEDPAVVNSIVQLFVREGTRIANEVSLAIEEHNIGVIRARLHELRPNLHNMGMDEALAALENFRAFIVDDQIVGDGPIHGNHMVSLIRRGIEDMKIHLEKSEG
jgi:PAS domain S-box-containing protein